MSQLTAEVAIELERAQSLFPKFNGPHEGYAVILEELDELWDEVKTWKPGSNPSKMRKEAIQVAAMALRFVHDVCDMPRMVSGQSSVQRELLRQMHPGSDW